MTITEHIAAVRREMAEAARESGRSERDIILVGASKMNDAAACQEAVAAGVDALGENRVQEMVQKLEQHAYDGAPLPLHRPPADQQGKQGGGQGGPHPLGGLGAGCCGPLTARRTSWVWCRTCCWR